MKKVLITGANGFLGCNVTRELFRQGYEIRILVRPQANLSALADIPCEVFHGHVDNKEDVFKAVADCNVVVHAAAVTDQWNVPYAVYESVNFTATKYIAEAVLHYKVQRLIFVSSAATMQPGTKKDPGTELNGFTMFKTRSDYILTKYLAQQYLLEQVEQKQLPAIVVNPTFMIGAYDSKPSSGQLLLYGLHKKILFYPPGGKNFVHVQDVCRGIASAIEQGKTGECYLLAHRNMNYKEFYKMVFRQTGTSPVLIRIPTFILRGAGLFGSLVQRLRGKAGKLNYTTAYLISMRTYYSGKKSERELLITYTPIEDAIQEALVWFKEHNYY